MEAKDFEDGIRIVMARSFVDNLSSEEKDKLFEGALVKSFENLTRSYSVEQEIQTALKEDMLHYAGEYILDPETQEALKAGAHKRVDDLIDAVIDSLGHELEQKMKSGYYKYLARTS